MPGYGLRPDLGKMIKSHGSRLDALEAKIAYRAPQGLAAPLMALFDANMISNGSIDVIDNQDLETGVRGWRTVYWIGEYAIPAAETSDPLDGLVSMRLSEHADSYSRVYWNPATSNRNPVVGEDVFPTNPGETWEAAALVRCDHEVTAGVWVVCGTLPADCYGIFGDQHWVPAASALLVPGEPAMLSGTITVPDDSYFVTLMLAASTAPPSEPWTWWADDLSLRKGL